VNKVWQVPNAIATTTCGHGPYVAASFRSSTSYWNVISRSSLLKGDVLASTSHVMIFDHGDPWGSLVVWEAKGCSYGVVHNWRTASSSYSAARRINISNCQCSPGQAQEEPCGNCGTRHRVCQSNCQWGGWSDCLGQGPCSPGAAQSRSCCDCGTETRTCSNSCQWNDWGTCSGPDPAGGTQVCDTGEPGPCADGRMRCQQGCLACVRTYDPVPEVCDAVDNDCSGEVDDGFPSEMGATPPPYAAALRDYSFSSNLVPGETTEAWVTFRNMGGETWRSGEVWLGSLTAAGGEPSPLYAADSWPSWDVAATLDEDVEPGETGFFSFSITAPDNLRDRIDEGFRLTTPEQGPLNCPSPMITLSTGAGAPDHHDTGADDVTDDPPSMVGGCRVSRHDAAQQPVLLWLLMLLFGGRGLRRRRADHSRR